MPKKGKRLDAKEGNRKMEGMKMVEAVIIAGLWYIIITLAMAVLATAYNHLLNQDGERAIPVCFKVVAGVVATVILDALRFQPLAIFAAIYVTDLLKLDGGPTVVLIVALVDMVWTANAILAYSAMGIPLIIGDMIRWANARKRNQVADSSAVLAQQIEQIIDNRLSGSGK